MTRIIVAGASGQTGAAVVAAAQNHPDMDFVAGIGRAAGADLPTRQSVADAPAAEALIDFTSPAAAVTIAKECADRALPLVTGTTGLSPADQAVIATAAKTIPVVQSGNFSLGVNLLMALVEQTAAKLEEFDIEIAEAHHRRKVDAPSGTALMLGEAAAHGRKTSLQEKGAFARHGQTGPRAVDEIGFSVTRGGGVFGDHDVVFLAEDEVLTLSHRALNRSLFAQGALRAAQWIVGKPAGLYTMRDVLDLA